MGDDKPEFVRRLEEHDLKTPPELEERIPEDPSIYSDSRSELYEKAERHIGAFKERVANGKLTERDMAELAAAEGFIELAEVEESKRYDHEDWGETVQ